MSKDTEETQRKILELQKAIRGLEREGLQNTEAYNNLYAQLKDKQVQLKNESKNFVSNIKEGVKSSTMLRNSLNDIAQTFKDVASVYVSFNMLTDMTKMLRANKDLNIELHRTLINSGKHGESLRAAKQATLDLRTELGASFEDAKEVISVLSQKQYVGNLHEAATASYEFARATGLTYGEVSQLTVDLQKMGKVSGKTTTAMYADLLKIQQANGMTKEGMKAAGEQIVKNAANMRAWGKSESDIRNMAAKTGLLISQFEKVGISAHEAAGFVDELLNPENIEDNIAKYAALGISISDAINGEIDEGQLTTGLKEFGNKLKEMGPIAGKAYAKAMGISYSQAIKATDIEDATVDAMTPEEQAADSLKQLTENTKAFEEKISDMANRVEGFIQKLPGAVLLAIAIIKPILGKKIASFISETKSKIINGSSETAEEAEKRLEKMFSGKKLKVGDMLKTNMEDVYAFMDKQTIEVKKDMEAKLGEVFTKMEKRGKGAKWFSTELNAANLKIQSINSELNNEISIMTETQKQLDLNKKTFEIIERKKQKSGNLTEMENALLERTKKRRDALLKTMEEAKKKQEQYNKSLIIARDRANDLKEKLEQASRVKSITVKVKEQVQKAGGAIKGGASFVKNKVGAVAKVAGGVLGGVMKVLGPIGIAAGIIMAILKKNEKFQKAIEKLMNTVTKVISNALEPVLEALDINLITDTIVSLVKMASIVIVPVLKVVASVINTIAKIIKKILEVVAKIFHKQSLLNGISDNTKETAENTSNDQPTNVSVRQGVGVITTNTSAGESAASGGFSTSADSNVSSSYSAAPTSSSNSSSGTGYSSDNNTKETRNSNADVVAMFNKLYDAFTGFVEYSGKGSTTLNTTIKSALEGMTMNINKEGTVATVNNSGSWMLGQ